MAESATSLGFSEWQYKLTVLLSLIEHTSSDLPDYVLGQYVTDNPAGIRTHPYSTST